MAYTPEKFADDLGKAWGGNLLSALLYGSAVTGEYDARRSDHNLLLVVRDSVRAGGRDTVELFRRWSAEGNPPPLVMTVEFMKRSADVFPMEWLDIRERRKVLSGKDPVSRLRVGGANYRLELERELKSNLLRLQGKYRLVAGRAGDVRELIAMSSSTFFSLFRSCLRLSGLRSVPAKGEAALVLGRRMRIDVTAFGYALRLRSGERSAVRADPDMWMARYVRSIMAVITKVEKMNRRIIGS